MVLQGRTLRPVCCLKTELPCVLMLDKQLQLGCAPELVCIGRQTLAITEHHASSGADLG